MKIAFCLAIGLLIVLHSPPSSMAQPLSAQAQADVTLTIEPWSEIIFPSPPLIQPPHAPPEGFDIIMDTVHAVYFGNLLSTTGGMELNVITNTDVTLQCTTQDTLHDGNTYQLNVNLQLMPTNLAYITTEPEGSFWNLDFPLPPPYDGSTPTLQVSVEKTWGFDDLAGNYYGDITLTLIPQ